MKSILAVMVNWNGGDLAVESARSVLAQTSPVRLWIVDNDSKDGSLEAMAKACPSARITRNQRNTGFAFANNQVLRDLPPDVDWVLLVNNDVILPDPGSLQRLVESAGDDPSIQGFCGRYEYPDGRFQHFYNQLPDPLILMTQWGVLRHIPGMLTSKRMRRYAVADSDFEKPMTLEQPAFSCVLARASAVRQLGGFDEQFPIFFNDIDFCWRWRQQGWTWHYRPDWRIIHHKSTSTSRLGGLLQAEMLGSAMAFCRKHLTSGGAAAGQLAVFGEAAFRHFRHGDLGVPLRSIWHAQVMNFERPSHRRAEPNARAV